MTNEEAIDIIKCLAYHNLRPSEEEIDEAIKALEQESKTGYWVEENINEWSRKVFCSECGCPPSFEYVSTGDVYSTSGYGVINKTKFCSNCGARMENNDNPKCSSCSNKGEDSICYGCVNNDEYKPNREDCLAYNSIDCEGRDCSECSIFNEEEK